MTKTKLIKLQDRVDELERRITLYQNWFNNPNVKEKITEAWIQARCSQASYLKSE